MYFPCFYYLKVKERKFIKLFRKCIYKANKNYFESYGINCGAQNPIQSVCSRSYRSATQVKSNFPRNNPEF